MEQPIIPPKKEIFESTMYFTAKDPGEEYLVTRKFLCPTCQNHLELMYQELFKVGDREIGGDRLVYKCKQCEKNYMFVFYLPPDYDPHEYLKSLKKRMKVNWGIRPNYNPKERKRGQQSTDGMVLAAFIGPVELWKKDNDHYRVLLYLSPEKTIEEAKRFRLQTVDEALDYNRAFEIFILAGGMLSGLPDDYPMLKYFAPESSSEGIVKAKDVHKTKKLK